jgi:riboflavin kinase/FMN adenylyltransferase
VNPDTSHRTYRSSGSHTTYTTYTTYTTSGAETGKTTAWHPGPADRVPLYPAMNLLFGQPRVELVPWTECTVAIGHFDGVHKGHQALIAMAVQDAREHGRPCVVVTFDRNPLEVVGRATDTANPVDAGRIADTQPTTAHEDPRHCPPYLCTLAQRLERIALSGADHTLVLPFDTALSQIHWMEFAKSLLRDGLHCRHLVAGHDFHFGHGREGSIARVQEHREELQMDATAMEPALDNGHRVSSTDIRAALLDGKVRQAASWLGRYYELIGVVMPGDAVGRTLGYPTVNLSLLARLVIPADGVYAAWAKVEATRYAAAVSIGSRPTLGDGPRLVEAFLLDYAGGDLYGRNVTLQFVERIREQRRYETLEALTGQIEQDVLDCVKVLEASP